MFVVVILVCLPLLAANVFLSPSVCSEQIKEFSFLFFETAPEQFEQLH